MFLNNQDETLDVSFKCKDSENSDTVFVTTKSLRCFKCRDIGHKRLGFPHRGVQSVSSERAEEGTSEKINKVMRMSSKPKTSRESENIIMAESESPECSTGGENITPMADRDISSIISAFLTVQKHHINTWRTYTPQHTSTASY